MGSSSTTHFCLELGSLGALDLLARSQLHGFHGFIRSSLPGIKVVGWHVGGEGWIKFFLEGACPIWKAEANIIQGVVCKISSAPTYLVLVWIECPLRQDSETLASLTVREFA